MTVVQMRTEIAKAYSSNSWQMKVRSMRDSQVIAVYMSFKSRGKI